MSVTGINYEYTFYYPGMEGGSYPHIIVTSGVTYSGIVISGLAYIYNFDTTNVQKWYCEYLREICYAAMNHMV